MRVEVAGVSALTIAVASLADEGLAIDSEVEGASLRPKDAGELGVGKVRIQGELTPMDGEFLFQGTLATTFVGVCDRCLDPVVIEYETVAVWTFVPGTPDMDAEDVDADDSATYFAGTELDLGARAWEELVLAQPSKFLCRESCKGLCPQCGRNLNEGPCECRTAEPKDEDSASTRKSLAGLGELFPDLKPGAPED
jgi:uncharacterized protein